MINPFNMFYDTEIAVYEAGKNDYETIGEKTEIGNIVCDIQPYSDEAESKIYGLEQDRKYKLFCDRNDLIQNGRYVFFGGEWYIIIKTENWKLGMTALISIVR